MPDAKEPRPLKYVWASRNPVALKWHHVPIMNGMVAMGLVTCGTTIFHYGKGGIITADTPNKDKCCVKCWEKIHA